MGSIPAKRDDSIPEALPVGQLLGDIRTLIEEARVRVAREVNSGLVMLYWHIGQRILEDILGHERADYGKQIVATLSRQLTAEYGKGFTTSNLLHMVRLAEVFPDQQILYAVRRELTWTHLREIMYLDDALKREFYTEMCRLERWSTRTLRDRIRSMLFERTAISRKPEETVRQELAELRTEDRLTPDLVFRDPFPRLPWPGRHV